MACLLGGRGVRCGSKSFAEYTAPMGQMLFPSSRACCWARLAASHSALQHIYQMFDCTNPNSISPSPRTAGHFEHYHIAYAACFPERDQWRLPPSAGLVKVRQLHATRLCAVACLVRCGVQPAFMHSMTPTCVGAGCMALSSLSSLIRMLGPSRPMVACHTPGLSNSNPHTCISSCLVYVHTHMHTRSHNQSAYSHLLFRLQYTHARARACMHTQ